MLGDFYCSEVATLAIVGAGGAAIMLSKPYTNGEGNPEGWSTVLISDSLIIYVVLGYLRIIYNASSSFAANGTVRSFSLLLFRPPSYNTPEQGAHSLSWPKGLIIIITISYISYLIIIII
jgi:hypothetical protein